jgi:putative transposase
MDSPFVIQTLKQALDVRKPDNTVLFHSDRGSQYTSLSFRRFCDENNVTQSFSKKGYPWDNSVMEAFFKYAKQEEFSRRSFVNISEVKMAAFQYIEGFYNSKRPHSANKMLTPNQKEAMFCENI